MVIKPESLCVVSFDESFNKIIQQEQMRGRLYGRLEAVAKVTILFLLWSGKIIFSLGILKLISCVNPD